MRATFDLIEEPWIPCVRHDGKATELGLGELTRTAHEIERVVDTSPLSTFALHRFLLAVVHSVLRGPNHLNGWKAIWNAGRFDASAFESYFSKWRDRFDLFHPTYPFMQVGGYETVSGSSVVTTPVTRLEPQRASGNNATLFDHSDERYPQAYTPARAARALLVAQAWALGGGKGPTGRLADGKTFTHPYSSHAPLVGGVAVLVQRSDLFRTLVANLAPIGLKANIPFLSADDDAPTWERSHVRRPEPATPTGYLEYLTWLSRYVRLIPNEGGAGTVDMYYAQGAIIEDGLGYENPFAFHREDDKRGRYPVGLSPDKAIWRDSSALFAVSAKGGHGHAPMAVQWCRDGRRNSLIVEDGALDLFCVGLANDKAKPLTWRAEHIPMPVRLIDSADSVALLDGAIENAQRVWFALQRAVRRLAQACLETDSRSPDAKDVTRLQTRMLERVAFWETMEGSFHRYLSRLDEDGRTVWKAEAIGAARSGLGRASGFVQGGVARVGRALALAQQTLDVELAKATAPTTAPTLTQEPAA